MKFFNIIPDFSTKKDKNIHPSVFYKQDDAKAFLSWSVHLQSCVDGAKEQNIPINFEAVWWFKDMVSFNLADWPAHTYPTAVCSNRMWTLLAPHCPTTTWMKLNFGSPVCNKKDQNLVLSSVDTPLEWGVLAGLQKFHIDHLNDETNNKSVPMLCKMTSNNPYYTRYAVSAALRQILEEASLVGLAFTELSEKGL